MSSEVDICNAALSHLGDSANITSISPPEGSVQAEHCARYYPMARDAMLEMHDWSFATRRVVLALQTIPPSVPATSWHYAYAMPAGVAKLISVLAPEAADNTGAAFEVENLPDGTPVIYSNTENAVLRYVARVTDPTRFSSLFTDALGWLLASYLAGPIIKGDAGAATGQACFKTFLGQLTNATGSDARQRHVVDDYVPAGIRARGGRRWRDHLVRG
jgi:hypothetical protein